MDFMMVVCTFCIIAVFGNRVESSAGEGWTVGHSSAATTSHTPSFRLKKEQKKSLKKLVNSLRSKYRKSDATGRALLILLAVVVALGLFWLLALLACGIACNGAEVLALVVLILGSAGIITAFVAVVKSIGRKHKQELQQTSGTM